jgi:GrpB-like predicted nucleotidyltransferase (UPF0157 family)
VGQPVVYLISGLAGAAKSTVARLLAARHDRGVHLDGDAFRSRADAAAAADAHFAAGSTVALEAVVPDGSLGDYRTMIRSRPCHVIVLFEAGGVLDRRDAPGRADAAEAPRVGIWLDTTCRTPQEILDEILRQTSTERSPIVVVDYDEGWPALFEEIAGEIRAAVADLDVKIEHVGSTAVPGLAAKPIVDVDVVVGSTDNVPDAIERLRALGYVYQGDKGIAGREAFLWPPGSEPHHLYVVVAGSAPYRDHVDFRDYLRRHPEVAQEYASLKRRLAEQHAHDRVAYTDGKSDFAVGVLRAARGSAAA